MKDKLLIDTSCDQLQCLSCVSCPFLDGYNEKMDIVNSFMLNEFEIVRSNKDYRDDVSNYDLLSIEGKYTIDFIDLVYRLGKLIDDINIVETLITKYSVVNIITIDEIDYINFYLEIFYHKINTINDVLKLLVNHVYKLEIDEKLCDWKSISQRRNDINPNALDIIEKYYKSFKSIIHIRNLNTHRNLNVNPSSKMISALLLVKKIKAKQMDPIFLDLVNEKLESHKMEKIDFIRSSKDTAKFYIDFFNAFLIDDVLEYLKINKK